MSYIKDGIFEMNGATCVRYNGKSLAEIERQLAARERTFDRQTILDVFGAGGMSINTFCLLMAKREKRDRQKVAQMRNIPEYTTDMIRKDIHDVLKKNSTGRV